MEVGATLAKTKLERLERAQATYETQLRKLCLQLEDQEDRNRRSNLGIRVLPEVEGPENLLDTVTSLFRWCWNPQILEHLLSVWTEHTELRVPALLTHPTHGILFAVYIITRLRIRLLRRPGIIARLPLWTPRSQSCLTYPGEICNAGGYFAHCWITCAHRDAHTDGVIRST